MEVKITETTNEYEIYNGTLIKHFVTYHYPRPVTITHYTAIKNGKESKKFQRVGNATNWMERN